MTATTAEIELGLKAAWAAIQHRHDDLPAAAITVVRYAADQYGDFVGLHVYLSQEALAKGGRKTFEALAHQAVHILAEARGISDYVKGYHNRRFSELAATMGLWVEKTSDRYGRSTVILPDKTAQHYAFQIGILDGLLDGFTLPSRPTRDAAGRPRGPARRDRVKIRCDCRWFRVSEAKFRLAPLKCEGCGKRFWVE